MQPTRLCVMSSGLARQRSETSLRARHRLGKFLLRHGWHPPQGVKAWTVKHMEWVKKDVEFGHEAQKSVLLDYITEVDHARDRIDRLDKAIDEAAAAAPERMRAVIDALQALRGIAKVSAVTIDTFAIPRK